MSGRWLVFITSIFSVISLVANPSSAIGAIEKRDKEPRTETTQITQNDPPGTQLTEGDPPIGRSSLAERPLDSLRYRIGTLENSMELTRNLLYVVITIQSAIVLAILGVAWWIERKVKKVVKVASAQVTTAKAKIDRHAEDCLSSFQSKIEDTCRSSSSTLVVQDLLLSGKVLLWTGKPEKALEPLDTAVSLDKDNPEVRKFRGMCLVQTGRERIVEAIGDLEFALSSAVLQNDASTYLELARAYLASGDYASAADRARKANLFGHPSREQTQLIEADSLRGIRKYDEAAAIYDNIIVANPRCTPAVLRKAEMLFERGDLDGEIALLNKAVDDNSNVSKYHVFLGAAHAERNSPNDWNIALGQFDEAEKVSKTDWDLWYYKGRAYLRRWLSLGCVGSEMDLLDRAKECFRRGEQISKRTGISRFSNQISRIDLLAGRVDDAVAEARRSVDANSSYVQNHLALAVALLASKRWPDAVAAAETGLMQARNAPGMIWCSYFVLLGKALQRFDVASLRNEVDQVLREIENAPFFDIKGWDWAITERVISDEVSRLPENTIEMLADMRRALENPALARSIRQRWVQ
jgi:tetratricopeptide (TPR) repeat protein